MNLPLLTGAGSELCADSRTVPSITGGMHLHTGDRLGLDTDPHLDEVNAQPRMPQITPLSYGPGALGSPLTTRFLDRLPAEALDMMGHVPLPSLDDGLDLFALGARADELGLFVQVPTARLAAPQGGRTLPLAQHRVVPLDIDGQITTLAKSAMVRVVPTSSRSAGAYRDASDDVATIWADRPYLSGRVVSGPDGVELGLPSGLTNQRHGLPLTRFGRPLEHADVETADPDAAGTVQVDGYVDLLYRMESLPRDSQALVTVHGSEGETSVFLGHRDSNGVAFLDPGTGGAASFPADPSQVQLTSLADTMPLGDRLDALNEARFGPRGEPSWSIVWPADAHLYHPEGGEAEPIVVLGAVEHEPRTVRDRLVASLPKIDQPIIVLGADRSGAPPDADRVTALGSLLEQYGWRDKVPVVVTRAGMAADTPATAALGRLLDSYGASLVHPVTQRPSPSAGGLTSFLGNPWTVREANASTAARRPPVDDNLTSDLLAFAAGARRRPAYAPPPESVATFLSTPLSTRADVGAGLDMRDVPVRTLGPLVRQIANRDPAFAPHNAAVQLVELGHSDVVTSYLDRVEGRGDTIFKPLLAVDGKTAADRQQGIKTLLPHLSTLAGDSEIQDYASHAILRSLNDLLSLPAGSADADRFRKQIWDYKDYLPDDGKIRVEWQRRLGQLKEHLPEEYEDDVNMVTRAIMTCP